MLSKLSDIKDEDRIIYSFLEKSFNHKISNKFRKINIWMLIFLFLVLLIFVIIGIYTKNNIFYILTSIPIILIIIFPILLIKIKTNKEKKSLENWINSNNKKINEILNINVSIKNFKIKLNKNMFSKGKSFKNEIIKKSIIDIKKLA